MTTKPIIVIREDLNRLIGLLKNDLLAVDADRRVTCELASKLQRAHIVDSLAIPSGCRRYAMCSCRSVPELGDMMNSLYRPSRTRK